MNNRLLWLAPNFFFPNHLFWRSTSIFLPYNNEHTFGAVQFYLNPCTTKMENSLLCFMPCSNCGSDEYEKVPFVRSDHCSPLFSVSYNSSWSSECQMGSSKIYMAMPWIEAGIPCTQRMCATFRLQPFLETSNKWITLKLTTQQCRSKKE